MSKIKMKLDTLQTPEVGIEDTKSLVLGFTKWQNLVRSEKMNAQKKFLLEQKLSRLKSAIQTFY